MGGQNQCLTCFELYLDFGQNPRIWASSGELCIDTYTIDLQETNSEVIGGNENLM